MSWASYIPSEISVQPLPLIVLTGLDVKHNAIHKEIWDGFNSRSNLKFRYTLLDGDHEYPKAKSKRSMEVYVEKGILKTNWFNKHLYQVPSLVVVFFDLDWDEPNWKEKQMECATKVELVRHSLLERNTRIILILIQKHPSIPVDGDNGLARERYPALCTACSIKSNYLFLLHAEYLQGYILKLEEDAFTEPTQAYYNLEIKSIKLKRDLLIKVTHEYLLVRLPIKMAFFSEMKQEVFKAIDNYKQAYLNLLDIRCFDTNILEIKTVASIINYKLCKLLFEIKHPIDAIEQFRRHTDIFKIKVGQSDLAFEHSAWLSKQFQVMGELFENAINKEYFNAVQTQHPGFYFHSAANNALQRRISSTELLKNKIFTEKQFSSENPSPIESLNSLEFFGQRPWRQGKKTLEIIDQQKEKDGILCLQELESKENLTPLITALFKQAISHFKVFNSKRMKQYLSVCMAEEYFFAKDYQQSLNIYVNVLNDYNNEHWWPILTSIMFNALKCAFLVADITNYCLLCAEIIGKNIILSHETKSVLQDNLIKVLENQVPLAEPHQIDTNIHSVEQAKIKWSEEFSKQLSSSQNSHNMETSQILSEKLIPAHVSGMVPFVDCKVQFTSVVFNSNEYIEIKVYLKTNCIDTIQFDKLYVRFNIPNYNPNCIIENKNELKFEPNKIYQLRFKFLPEVHDINKDLEINSISLELGNREIRALVLNWKGDCKNAISSENFTINAFSKVPQAYNNKDPELESNIEWSDINILSTTSIVSRKSKIELELVHKQPIIVNEYYPIKLIIINKEESRIENLSLSVEILSINSASDIDTPISTVDKKIASLWINNIDKNLNEIDKTISLPNLEPKQEISQLIFIQIKELKAFNLSLKVKYDLNVFVRRVNYTNETDFTKEQEIQINEFDIETKTRKIIKCSCVQENKVLMEAINPFEFSFKFLSMQMGQLDVIRFGEPFLALCEITNQTNYALRFKNSSIIKGDFVRFSSLESGETEGSFLKDETLKPGEIATECFCLIVEEKPSTDQSLNKKIMLGEFVLKWKRRNLAFMLGAEEINEEDDSDGSDDSDESDEEIIKEKDKSLELDSDLMVTTRVRFPEVQAEFFPFIIETKLPTYSWLGKEVNINYKIKNKTQNVLDIECSLEENDFFALSGKKMELMQIMPYETNNFSFLIYPLKVGHCKLPKFHVKINNPLQFSSTAKAKENQTDDIKFFDSAIENMIPSQLFIFPEKMDTLLKE